MLDIQQMSVCFVEQGIEFCVNSSFSFKAANDLPVAHMDVDTTEPVITTYIV